ncbi:uncharacterized protein LOC107361320 [Tetranychus urticae]|uniref:RAP domain-containing protein n=1 Tax=Tetranychus urticae TaxID=32264 RepID=T1JQD8_TETUR|nr:uncharacterized protein LOC107361320 [Tetranychus urticae]
MLNQYFNLFTHSCKLSPVIKIHRSNLTQPGNLLNVKRCLASLSLIDHSSNWTNVTTIFKKNSCSSKYFSVNGHNITKRQIVQRASTSDNDSQYAADLDQLWSLRAFYTEGDVKNSLLSDNKFREICTSLMKKLRYLSPTEVRSLAHLVIGINLPTNVGITKGVLQMLRVHLNEYDARELADIYLLLERNRSFERDPEEEREPSNPVLKALLIALPKAMEQKIIGKQFYASNSSHLLLILKASITAKVNTDSIRFLFRVIFNKIRYMHSSQLIQLFGLLCHQYIESNIDSIGRPLVGQILDRYWQRIDAVLKDAYFEPDYYFDETLKTMCLTDDKIYYNSSYCDSIYELYGKLDSLDNFNAFDDLLWFGMKYNHYSLKAVEKVMSLIVSKPDSFLWDSSLSSSNIIQIMGKLNWKPTHVDWNTLCPILIEDVKLSGSRFYSSTKTLISYLVLKEHDLFEELSEHEASSIIDKPEKDLHIFYQDILTLNIGVKCEAMNVTSSTLKSTLDSYIEEAIIYLNSNRSSSLFEKSLSSYLKLCCGGPKNVANNIWTSYGHFINNLIMINRDGKPNELVTSNNDQNGLVFLHNYQIDPQSQLVAVLPTTDDDFCVKPYKLKGEMDLRYRTLETLGIKILRIHVDTWKCLTERERGLFLVRELSEITGQEFKSSIKELID